MNTYTIGDAPTLTGSIGASAVAAVGQAHIKQPDGGVLEVGEVTWTDEDAGDWSIDLGVDVLTQPGLHRLEVEVMFAGGRPQTFALDADDLPVEFMVRQQFA